ncbi:family 43 glycosylhydrolase [Sporanaerobium hydrogeniformans]|uniref:family 43 glycosylhydrolase n=1 Tax=Sporanaerobium hydrogeniformans TaxID=3072179 RepID=UPI0015D482CA|nr:family 43 glycosylhydrolase [Sporanaerobium hydrogeniformans]
MRKKIVTFLLVFTLVLSYVPTISYATQGGNQVSNPLMWSDVPDVSVIRVGDVYYMSSTTMHMNPGVPIMKSYDLVNWEIVNYVYDVLDTQTDALALRNGENAYGKGSWASSLKYHDGKFYIAFACYNTGKTYIYQTDDIENGPWERSELTGVYHDMSLQFDEDGRVYMIYGGGDIKIVELTEDASAIKSGTEKVIITDASKVTGISGGLAEGAQIFKVDGKYYLFLITWPTGSERTVLCYRADNINGPYEGKVVLKDKGIAQGGIFDTPDGKWYSMLFGDRGAVGRIPYLVPVEWQDGWPVFGIDGKVPDMLDMDATKLNLKIVSSDEFYQYQPMTMSLLGEEVSELVAQETREVVPKELIENGDFEASTIEPWTNKDPATLTLTSSEKYSGLQSLSITNRTVGSSGPMQSLAGKLKAGNTYQFSAKVKYLATTSQALDIELLDTETSPREMVQDKQFNFCIQTNPSDWQTIKVIGSKTINKGEWGIIEGTYTIPTNADVSKGCIFIETPWAAAPTQEKDLMDFYVDEVSFMDVTPAEVEEGDYGIIQNGGFETGLDPWTGNSGASIEVVDDVYYSGSKSLKITNRKDIAAGPKQDIKGKVQSGKQYKVSAKVRYNAGPATRKFNMNIQSGNWETIKNMASATITKGEWGSIEGIYTIPVDMNVDNAVTFIETSWVQNPVAEDDWMDFYVDDISIVDITPDPNIIQNGGFEKGKEPWIGNSGATITVVDDVYYSGSKSLKISGRNDIADGPRQEIPGKVKNGRQYKISAKVRYDEGPATRKFNMNIQSGNWETIKNMASGTMKKGEWGSIEGVYTIPDNTDVDNAFIFIETSWAQNPTAENDWMDFYVDDISMIDVTPENVDQEQPGENDYNGSDLALVWQWNHNPDNTKWSLTERTGYLRLTTGKKSTSILDARNTLTQRTFGPECSGSIAMDVNNMKNGDYAGLAAFQNKYGYVGVKMINGSKSIVRVNGKGAINDTKETIEEVASIPLNQNKVYFKVDFDYKNRTDKAYFYYSLDGTNWSEIGSELQLEYTLPHFMGYRFALFNYATKTTGGYVDFDYFRIEEQASGIQPSGVLLGANLSNVSDVLGVQNTEFEVPLMLDALPEGDYTSISASLNIPKELAVTDVLFNSANLLGDTSYTYLNNRLQLSVKGNAINVSNQENDKLFATIKLKVTDFIPKDKTVTINTDYITVQGLTAEGERVSYKVSEAVSTITLKALDTETIGKVLGYSNPLISHRLGADPYAITYNGRVYIYMSSDEFMYDNTGKIINNTFSNLNRVLIISSDDMVNWTDHGYVPVAGPNGVAKWAVGSWAPAAAHKKVDGQDKFFLYFANAAGGIGVLEGESPVGPWSDPLGKALITKATPGVADVEWLFDPAVLVDDDGTGYLYFGGGIPSGKDANPETARVVRLTDNMLGLASEVVKISPPYLFEDSGIHKYNGKYYYSYCSNFAAGARPEGSPPGGEIAYMVSDNPMGPFTYVSSILKNPSVFFGVGGNNHHAIFEFNGQWYIVYHAQTVSKELGVELGYRSPHINKLEYYSDGTIKNVAADMKGIAQLKSLNPYIRNEAETIAWNAGIETEICKMPNGQIATNMNVTAINSGDWIAVANAEFGVSGATSFEANIASTQGGAIEIYLDQPFGEPIGVLEVKSTGGEQEWQVMNCDVEAVSGIHTIFFKFNGTSSGNLFNFDYWKFLAKEITAVTNVNLSASTLSLVIGESSQLRATVLPETATNTSVTWTSDNEKVATVDQTGKITAVGAGTAIITVTTVDGNKTSNCEIIVRQEESEVALLTGQNSTVTSGGKFQVPITLAKAKDMGRLKATIKYDENLLTLNNVIFDAFKVQECNTQNLGEIVFNAVNPEGLPNNDITKIITLDFTAKGNVTKQITTSIMFINTEANRVGNTEIMTVETSPTIITIKAKSSGGSDSGSGGGSGSGSGSSNGSGTPSKPVVPEEKPQTQPKPVITPNTHLQPGNPGKLQDITKHWAKDPINKVVQLGYMVGKTETEFKPNDFLTRGEMTALLNRLIVDGPTGKASFGDIKGYEWYAGSIGNMSKLGLVSGYKDNTFRPNNSIKRVEVMSIIARLMAYNGMDKTVANSDKILATYKDGKNVPTWAKSDVAWCISQGIVTGDTQGYINSDADITRAELAVIINHILAIQK